MAEHSAVNRRVVGSSPTWGVSIYFNEQFSLSGQNGFFGKQGL